jgi:ribosomal protein S4
MRKNLKLKTSREFLKNDFPENVLPFKKLSNKDKRILQEKLLLLKKTRKRIKRLEESLQIKAKQEMISKGDPVFTKVNFSNYGKNKHGGYTCFLFSSDQIKNDLLRTQSYTKPSSDYLLKIKEKKKFSLLYGNVSRKFFQKAYLQAVKERGRINENLIIKFETRLDILLYRICFAKTIAAARQSINHNLISVNGIKINVSSYQVKPGDIVSVDVNRKKKLSNQILNVLKKNVNNRRFRFLISIKCLERNIGNQLYSMLSTDSFKITNSVKQCSKQQLKEEKPLSKTSESVVNKVKHHPTNPFQSKEKNKKLTLMNQGIQKLTIKIKKLLYTTKKRNTKKRTWFVETLLRINRLTTIQQETYSELNDWQTPSRNTFQSFLQEKRKRKFLYLKLKRLMYRRPSRYTILSAMRISPMKPLNVEVSYKIMSAIILYHPQKIVFPTTINIDLLSRSIAQR